MDSSLFTRDQLATGEWLKESGMVRVLHETGKFWQYMGAETDIGKCLYPEEALYLIDTGELEVSYGDVALSLQQAQTVMLQDAHHVDQYLVYAHLSRTGCKVVRHQTHLVYTRYETQIGIDRHQVSKKGVKLKLKGKNKSNEAQRNKGKINTKNEALDEVMKEFYDILGPSTGSSSTPHATDTKKENSNKAKGDSKTVKEHIPEEEFTPYEKKRRELLDMLPTMQGEKIMSVSVEPKQFLPKNSIPIKPIYQISLEALNYYSLYDTTPQNVYNRREKYDNWNRKGEPWCKEGNKKYQDNRAHWTGACESDCTDWRKENAQFSVQWNKGCERDREKRRYRVRWDNNRDVKRRQYNRDGWMYGREQRGEDNLGWREQHWRHHDDRCAQPSHFNRQALDDEHRRDYDDNEHERILNQHTNERGLDGPEEGTIDYTKKPEWKTRRRRWQRKDVPFYPSCIVRLNRKVNSWKEYKRIVKEMSADKLLADGPGQTLWRGPTTPLIRPAMATSIQSVLSGCSMKNESIASSSMFNKEKLPQDMHLTIHYDVYLATVPYKKTDPGLPSKRITVMRDRNMPTPGQILEVSTRFHDDVPIVGAVVVNGEVRLYTLTSLTLPQPIDSLR
ncbi:tRNA-splicing endonuclease subunit Sen54-like isoform X2 [Homarus americanus]|uniref:tRNA-splicing endonuclease subunit Sen54-like isoform X2 n=1 Tax=Homarus americanus TaxID=6706 RepID=UPI001C46D92E|nr:tRNA-splicing endonuclease subunit Sen54-like isoform X2 [Homarus americanus]